MTPAVNVPSTKTSLWYVAIPTYVDKPETFKLSSSEWPKTSKPPSRSVKPLTLRSINVSTLVKDEFVTPAPRVVAERTEFPSIWYTFSTCKLKFSLDLSAVFVLS